MNLGSSSAYIPPYFGPNYTWQIQFIPGISLQATETFPWPTIEFKENYLYSVYSHCQDKLELAAALNYHQNKYHNYSCATALTCDWKTCAIIMPYLPVLVTSMKVL